IDIGNGGKGPPAYGLTPLGQPPSWVTGDLAKAWTALRDVAKPFPLTQSWCWEVDCDTAEEDKEKKQASVLHGNLNLGTDGCGKYFLLIVTGAARDQIWEYVAGFGIRPLDPRCDFPAWVEAWLTHQTG